MRYILATLAFLIALCASTAAQADPARFQLLTSTDTGITNGALASGGVTSNSIPLARPWGASEVAFFAKVTPGTTLRLVVSCEESPDNVTWYWLPFCEGEARAACEVAKLIFPVDNGLENWTAVPKPRGLYVRCTFEDELDGTGTVTVTAIKWAE